MNPFLKTLLHGVRDSGLPAIPLVLHSGPEGKMLVAGEERWTRYFTGRFFAGATEKKNLGSFRA